MARITKHEQLIDNTLILAYAKTNRLAQLEEFVTNAAANGCVAKLDVVAETLFDEGLYEPARLLFKTVGVCGCCGVCLSAASFVLPGCRPFLLKKKDTVLELSV